MISLLMTRILIGTWLQVAEGLDGLAYVLNHINGMHHGMAIPIQDWPIFVQR